MNSLTLNPAAPASALASTPTTGAPPVPVPCPAPSLEVTPRQLAQRQQFLAEVAAQLKTELFGIDEIIDRVINAARAWYVLLPLITRPVIVCWVFMTASSFTNSPASSR